jgi:hypothetical protein
MVPSSRRSTWYTDETSKLISGTAILGEVYISTQSVIDTGTTDLSAEYIEGCIRV